MLITLIRTLILYIFVTIGIRLMGKRQIGDMQPNELVVTLLISEIAAIPLQDTTQPLINGIIAIFVLAVTEILLSVASMKIPFIRRILSGKSVIIINDGKIDQEAMNHVRLTVIDLIELLRSKNVFNISDVAYAILEVNGSLSVLLKNGKLPANKSDVSAEPINDALSLPVIIDGKIINDTLKSNNLERKGFERFLKKENTAVKDVFLMMLDKNGKCETVNKRTKK